MDLMEKVNALVLGLAALLAVSCGGDGPEPSERNCKISKIVGQYMTHEYVYDNAGRIIRINNTDHSTPSFSFYHELDYNAAGKTSEIRTFRSNNSSEGKYIYKYNVANLLDTIVSFGASGIQEGFTVLEYNASGQLVRISDPQDTLFRSYIEYSYPMVQQVKVMHYNRDASGNVTLWRTSIYNYDDKKNPTAHLNIVPSSELMSPHNSISGSHTDHRNGTTDTISITYTYNAEGFPIQQTAMHNGQPTVIADYFYNCQ